MSTDPLEELYLDLQLDAMEEGVRDEKVEPSQVAAAMRAARALLSVGAASAQEPTEATVDVAQSRTRFEARLAPIATLAAADLVKATVRFEPGVLRLLQSTLRPDLAVEIVLEAPYVDSLAECLFLVRLASSGAVVAVLANESPVFTGASADKFVEATSVEIAAVPLNQLADAEIAALRRSRRNLRDPSSLMAYDRAIASAERKSR